MDLDLLTRELARFPEAFRPEPKPDFAARRGGRATIRAAAKFRATPERVFDAWLAPAVAGRWLFATAWRPMTRVAIDARVGGSFCFEERTGGAEHSGVYIEIDPPQRL